MPIETSVLLALNGIQPAAAKYVFLVSDSVFAIAGLAILSRMLRRKAWGGVQAALALFLVYLANSAIKVSVGAGRPELGVGGLAIFDPESTPSFPSTHSAVAFASAGLIGHPLAYLWAAAIAVSRVILGAHYPHDVIAGALLGYVLSKTLSSEKVGLLFSRNNMFETRRQLFHAFFGAAVAFAIYFTEKSVYVPLLSLAVAVSFALSICIKRNICIPGISWIIDRFEREKDRKNWPLRGSTFFIIGALAAAIMFSREVAFASVLILAVGDGATTLIGKPLGRHKHLHNRKKSIEGTLAGIFASYVAVAFFIPLNAAVAGALVFGIVESFDFQKSAWLDDNLIVPVAVGLAMSLI